MKNYREVREYDRLICNPNYRGLKGYVTVTEEQFEELETFIRDFTAGEEYSDASEFMKLSYKRNIGNMISISHYVGLIQTHSGFQLQILPKIDLFQENEKKREKELLVQMLKSLKDFPAKVFNDAALDTENSNLYEIFISMYVEEAMILVRHGLRSAYSTVEENLSYYRGKLMVPQHVRYNVAHQEHFFMSFDEFNINRPENRLIKSTLMMLLRESSSTLNQKKIRQILPDFDQVDPSTNYASDFNKIVMDRTMSEYTNLMHWSRVFLLNESFTTFRGSTDSRSLLFPMERLFEAYVGKELKKAACAEGWDVNLQDQRYYLFDEPKKMFAMRPDIVMRKEHRTIILDTKWKNLMDNPYMNYGVSQADMYQMYAYGKKYEKKDVIPEIYLLYPLNKEMQNHEPIMFSSEDGINVKVRFIDLRPESLTIHSLLEEIEG